MPRRRLIVLLACSITACTHPALGRFQTEHRCAAAAIEELGAHAYRVTGCGRVVNYVCDPRGYNQAVCIEEGAVAENAGAEGATANLADREDARGSTAPRMRLQEGLVGDGRAVRLSIPQLGGAELIYAPSVDQNNVIARAAPRIASRCTDAHAAIDDGHHPATVREPGTFAWARELFGSLERRQAVTIVICGHRAEMQGHDLFVIHQFAARVREMAVAQEPAVSGPEPTPTPPTRGPDAARLDTRGWLDANREAILGCANRPTAVVRVESSGGSIRISLQGALAGSAEEECVRAALGAPPPSAVPTAGVVIHAMR